MTADIELLVSILVPIYRVERFIEQCAISLFQQTYKHIEYVFVDDCSPDNSIATLKKVIECYPDRKPHIKIVRHEENGGLAAARYTALKHSTGSYVLNVDSDDYIAPTMVELMIKKAQEDGSEIVVCDYNYVSKDGIKELKSNVCNDKYEYISKMLMRRVPVCLCFRLIKRNLYFENLIFPIKNLNHGEDFVIVPRLSYFANKISYLQLPLYYYVNYNEESYTKNVGEKSMNEQLNAFIVLEDFFVKHNDYVWPLNEAKAINYVTLYYSIPKQLYSKIATLSMELELKSLKLSPLHKLVLWLGTKNEALLYSFVRMINMIR